MCSPNIMIWLSGYKEPTQGLEIIVVSPIVCDYQVLKRTCVFGATSTNELFHTKMRT
jgi:hypothetical protein